MILNRSKNSLGNSDVREKKDCSNRWGFRFLKDPLFFVSRFFLKSQKRIMVLMMIMTLALMVYSLGQRPDFSR